MLMMSLDIGGISEAAPHKHIRADIYEYIYSILAFYYQLTYFIFIYDCYYGSIQTHTPMEYRPYDKRA